MSTARTFAPWIAYAAGSALVDWRAGAAVGLLVAVRVVHEQQRQYGDVDDLTRTTRWFFLGLTLLALFRPESELRHYTPALSLAALGATAAWSLVEDRPFTLAIARRSAPPELWQHPAFVAANVTITRVWAASMLVTAAVCGLTIAVAPSAAALWITAQALGFVVPMWFTAAYRRRARARFAAAPATAAMA